MIIRRDQPPTVEESDGPENMLRSRSVGDAGGITQMGARVHTLLPGGRSSDRHWHEREDELIFVLSGEVTVIEDDGEHVLQPGDAACWPAGIPNAHHVLNRSDAPCSYFVVGNRVPHEVVHYPQLGRTLTIEGDSWELRDAHGNRLRSGGHDR